MPRTFKEHTKACIESNEDADAPVGPDAKQLQINTDAPERGEKMRGTRLEAAGYGQNGWAKPLKHPSGLSYAEWVQAKKDKQAAKATKKEETGTPGWPGDSSLAHDSSMSKANKTFEGDPVITTVIDPKSNPLKEAGWSLKPDEPRICPYCKDEIMPADYFATGKCSCKGQREADSKGGRALGFTFKQFKESKDRVDIFGRKATPLKVCPKCKGKSDGWGKPCSKCNGTGWIKEAFERRTTCQQCPKKLTSKERALGTICDVCVKKNKGKLYDPHADSDELEESLEYDDNDTTPRSDNAEYEYELKKNATVARNEDAAGAPGLTPASDANNNLGPGSPDMKKKNESYKAGPGATPTMRVSRFEEYIREDKQVQAKDLKPGDMLGDGTTIDKKLSTPGVFMVITSTGARKKLDLNGRPVLVKESASQPALQQVYDAVKTKFRPTQIEIDRQNNCIHIRIAKREAQAIKDFALSQGCTANSSDVHANLVHITLGNFRRG